MSSIAQRFLDSAESFPTRTAVAIGDESATYGELADLAKAIAQTLANVGAPRGPNAATESRVTAVFGHRHVEAFGGVLGALLRGDGYVPLNPIFPIDRNRVMLERCGATELVVDRGALALLPELLRGFSRPLTILVPHGEAELGDWCDGHRVVSRGDFAQASTWVQPDASPDSVAYILFTSGSTGIPKGVMVSHGNVHAFLSTMLERYQPTHDDRFSQTFDLTFDLSVFDMFMPWSVGACLVCPTAQEKLFPGKYVKERAITAWFSVPSTAVLMSRLRMLKPSAYPQLKWALFCGEALPVEVIEAWQQAAPNAVCENLYGPTELTIACTLYRWTSSSRDESEGGVVPIGFAYPGMSVRIENEAGNLLPVGEPGELLMTGPQLSRGYLDDPEKTSKAFVARENGLVFYRTGDRVVQRTASGPLLYLGRVDNQIKIQGYRVELGEIEAVLREVSGAEVAIAIGFPKTAAGADGIVAFVGLSDGDVDSIRRNACAKLAPYMHPSRVLLLETWPLNANGKVDRHALLQSLQTPEAAL